MIDSRMGLNSILTSSVEKFHPGLSGSTIANYVEFVDFIKNEEGKITGAKLTDTVTNKSFDVKCKAVANCTGIFSDDIRKADNPEAKNRMVGARGTHLMFKNGMLPENKGIIIPQTEDGRLLFVINYLGVLQVGTTDEKCAMTHNCEPTKEEIDFIVKEIKPYMPEGYDFEANLISAYAGIRPLVSGGQDKQSQHSNDGMVTQKFKSSIRRLAKLLQGKSSKTSSISRSHVIEVSDSGLVSLMGGKWTSFRVMGEHTVDQILETHSLDTKHKESQTLNFNLIGSYSKMEQLSGFKPAN